MLAAHGNNLAGVDIGLLVEGSHGEGILEGSHGEGILDGWQYH